MKILHTITQKVIYEDKAETISDTVKNAILSGTERAGTINPDSDISGYAALY